MKAMRPKKSGVWKYFEVDTLDDSRAVCKLCNSITISRGSKLKGPQSYGTSALWAHLKLSHRTEYSSLEKCPSYPAKIPKNPKLKCSVARDAHSSLMEMLDLSKPITEPLCLSERMDLSKPNTSKAFKSEIHPNFQREIESTITTAPNIEQKHLYLIGEMIALDNQPLSIVEETGFKQLIESLVPSCKLVGRQHFAHTILPQIYTRTKSKMESQLSQVEWLSVSLDIDQSSLQGEILIITTAYWIDSDFERKCFILNANLFPSYPSNKIVDSLLEETLNAWNIDKGKVHLVMHEHIEKGMNVIPMASDVVNEVYFKNLMQTAIEESLLNQETFSRVLDLCRNFICYSTETRETLDIMNLLHNVPLLKSSETDLVLDSSTDWQSTFHMLKNMKKHQDHINNLISFNQVLTITTKDWSIIENLIQVLEPMYKITEDHKSQGSTVSSIVPSLIVMMRYFEKNKDISKESNIEDELQRVFYQEFKLEERKSLVVATALDPRYKLAFLSEINKAPTKHWIIEDLLEGNEIEDIESKYCEVKSSILDCYQEIAMGPSQTSEPNSYLSSSNAALKKEIECYFNTALLSRCENPLEWWKRNQLLFPRLSKLAKHYLSAPLDSFFLQIRSEKLLARLRRHIEEDKMGEGTGLDFTQRLFLHLNLAITL